MTLKRRIFFSLTADPHLTSEQNELKWGIVSKITNLGYSPEVFTAPPERRIKGMASRLGWGFDAFERVMRRCCGHAIIGMPRWQIATGTTPSYLPTEFCQYEGAVSYTLKLPTIVIADDAIENRLVFDQKSRPLHHRNSIERAIRMAGRRAPSVRARSLGRGYQEPARYLSGLQLW